MNHPRQVLPSPPVDFPVYGLDASWPSSRWLELFGDAIGDPVRWVALGHRGRNSRSVIAVETFSRSRTDALVPESDWTPQQDAAHHAASTLINVTLPVQSAPRPAGIRRALANHAYEHSLQCAQWPLVRWRVDGAVVTALVWRFADGWAAISDAVEGVYLAAVGVGTAPDGLSLAVIEDGSAYHFGLDQPLHPRVMAASRERAGGDGLELHRRDWHADQLQLLRDQRSDAGPEDVEIVDYHWEEQMDDVIMPPVHPGEILLTEFLAPLELSQYQLARSIAVPARRINEIVHGQRRISADTALRLARFFETSERFWINLQSRYDLEVGKDRLGPVLDSIRPLASAGLSTRNCQRRWYSPKPAGGKRWSAGTLTAALGAGPR